MSRVKFEQNQAEVRKAIGDELGGLYNSAIANHIANFPMVFNITFADHLGRFVITNFNEEGLKAFRTELRELASKFTDDSEMLEEIVFTAAHHYVALHGIENMHDRMTLRVLKILVNN